LLALRVLVREKAILQKAIDKNTLSKLITTTNSCYYTGCMRVKSRKKVWA